MAITDNEKLALARAVYGNETGTGVYMDGERVFLAAVNDKRVDQETFDPINNANQCHECWDKLVPEFYESSSREVEIRFFDDEVVCLISFDRLGIVSAEPTELEARTAAMVQLPAVQTLLKDIEG